MALTRVSGNLIASGVSLTFNAGNAAFPALTTTGNTNTGIFFPAADTVATSVGGTEGMRLTSTGLGIGTSSPGAKLDVAGSAYVRGDSSNTTFTSTGQLAIKRSSSDPVLSFHNNTGGQIGNIQFQNDGVASITVAVNQALVFKTNATEQARIDSSGNVGIGTTSPYAKIQVSQSSSTLPVNWIFRGNQSLDNNLPTTYGFPYLHIGRSEYRVNSLQTIGFGYVSANGGNPPAEIGLTTTTVSGETYGDLVFATRSVTTNTAATERMRIDSAGNLGLGVTPQTWSSTYKPAFQFGTMGSLLNGSGYTFLSNNWYQDATGTDKYITTNFATNYYQYNGTHVWRTAASGAAGNTISFTQAMTLDASGNLLVGTTNTNPVGADINGFAVLPNGRTTISRMGGEVFALNRGTDDGILMSFAQAGSTEGNISVSGTTVSYNGGHLSRYAQTTTAKDDSLLKGTVLSNLDEMNVYTKDGQPVDNEQLNKVKVSDTEGDVNVAGVFVNWSHDEDHNVDEINMAMTGDMIIRIAQGVTVVRGDLLMSAGDGTAKPQGDDIVRSKTVAKVTSNHVTCTYADGSYCVPCVLMAC